MSGVYSGDEGGQPHICSHAEMYSVLGDENQDREERQMREEEQGMVVRS